ncbi:hypothetical protein [Ornithinimicrobium cerasi]|uniref:Uncharacterized protein n=1 Tax=Ornithinimicrobium cerasi TaxID=2248773 RepID=A0A285VHV2_9MICO|nr:hypothetical protein [Ornithinimicrobium cerasi]SOC52121.1 hypothetical protein SAMN05421879_101421 [Ornithinimicrobium cerasi]
MSEGRTSDEGRPGATGATGAGGDTPPMLVLGEQRPDVEDTTAEELARQRAELERQRRELEVEDRERRRAAEQEAERRRREAEERLAEERRLAEVELARRQRLLDDAERRLHKTERRLRRKARQTGGHVPSVASSVSGADPDARSGRGRRARGAGSVRRGAPNSLLAAAERRSGVPVPRLQRTLTLALLSSGLVVAGAIASVDPPSAADVEDFVTLDETRVAWLGAGLTLDQEVSRYLAGEEVTQEDGTLASVSEATAAGAASDVTYPVRDFEETVGPLLAEPGSNPQRVLSAWDEARSSAGYAVGTYEIRDAGELVDADRALPTWMLLGGVVAIGGLAYGLARGGTRVGAGLAGLALVPAGLVVADQGRHLDVEPALATHSQAVDDARAVYDQVGRDLQAVYGTRALESYERETFWEGTGYLEEDRHDPEALAAYTAARESLAGVDIRSLSTGEAVPHAQALVEAGGALLDAQTVVLEDARAAVLARTESQLEVGPYAVTTSAAAILPLAALVPALLRRRQVEG